MRKVLLAITVVALLFVSACASYYSPRYVYRVLRHQDSDFDDIEKFPHSAIRAPEETRPLPTVELDGLESQILRLTGDSELEAFIRKTETSCLLIASPEGLHLERYGMGFGPEAMQNTFSVSKAVTSLLVGIASERGSLSPDDPITRFLPELGERDSRFARITIENLLDMRSGIDYEADVSFPFVNADDPLIYYSPDLEKIVLGRTQIGDPPGTFEYNNYNPPLIGLILRRATGRTPSQLVEELLWDPIGAAQPAGWVTDDRGIERMESGFFAAAPDLARLGLMVLQHGTVDGTEVVPAEWIEMTTTPENPIELESYDGRSWAYRMGWWLVPRPEGPPDFTAIGRYGQFIYISPHNQLVTVRCGPGRGEYGDGDWTSLFYRLSDAIGQAHTH